MDLLADPEQFGFHRALKYTWLPKVSINSFENEAWQELYFAWNMHPRFFIIPVLFCALSNAVHAQSGKCTGNLGDNIFLQGDFGSGTDNIVQTDPGIAPGFQYSVIVPIDDGEYVLTNNMDLWPNIYPTWLHIGDNSPDLNGYMMVVNASFSPGIFYQETIDGLCENTLYEFSTDVINVVKQTVANHILPNVSFLIDSVEEFTTGPIPQNETWTRYGFTFVTKPGQEQVTLTLRNNAPGGIGNDLALDNISFRPCGPSATITIDMDGKVCENVLYPTLSAVIDADTGYVQWQVSDDAGTTWMDIAGATMRSYRSDQLSPNTYLFRYLYANSQSNLQNSKCRIVSASKRLEVVPVYYTIIDTLCEGLGFELGNETYFTSGTYMQHLQAFNGCDSIVTLHLQIVPDPGIQATFITTPPLCTGTANATISVQSVQNGTPEYLLAAPSYSPVSIHQPLLVTAGEYFVTITDRYGCAFSDAVRIEDPELFIIDLTGDSTTYVGHSVNLNVSGNYIITSLELNPAEGLICTSCTSTSASPGYTILYTATAVSPNGCIASDSLLILVDTDPRIYIPNVFSPNGDALNDAWVAAADPLNIKEIETLRVFDRWGNVLLELRHLQPEETIVLWDANAARDLAAGVYTYLIEIRLANDSMTSKSGTVTVIK